MSEEEAIEILEEIKENFNIYSSINLCEIVKRKIQAIDTVLKALKKKDMIIEKMANFISVYHCFESYVYDLNENCKKDDNNIHQCRDCIKEYFIKLVEDK